MKNLNEPLDPRSEATPMDHEITDTLIPQQQVEELRQRWTTVQSHFVDEPRKSVEEADQLVATTIQQIENGFTSGRSNLEKQWAEGNQASTEDLRLCLQHYRQFFDRLLSQV